MNIIVGCEHSQVVAEQFLQLGHNVFSCDLLPGKKGLPHIQENLLYCLGKNIFNNFKGWDRGIFFPPCTRLAVSGACRFKGKEVEQAAAIDFFQQLAAADISEIAIENPVGIMSTVFRKPDQYIQPYQFNENASKKTCLWLKNLKPLPVLPGNRYPGRLVQWKGKIVERWENQTDSGQNRLPPSETRAQQRGITYTGIAAAMAAAWG